MKLGRYNLHLHSIAAHFTNSLYPVAVFFLVLFELFQREAFHTTYVQLLPLALLATPVAYASGLIEWRQKFKGARATIFIRKYTFGMILIVLGSVIFAWQFRTRRSSPQLVWRIASSCC